MDKVSLSCMLWIFLMTNGEGGRILPLGKCRYSRAFKMSGADCSNLNLADIPTTTRSIEILDVSLNRIRTLKNSSFVSYSSLKFLYLYDNLITIIEPGAFVPLSSLEVLDLKLNAIREIPPLLPDTLQRLYLSENPVLETVPLSNAVSLTFVSLANSQLKSLPVIGILPQLQELNLTGNPMESITIDELGPFCQLKTLSLPYSLVQGDYLKSCHCVRVSTWILKHSIYVNPVLNCTIIHESECATNMTEPETYASCQAINQAIVWGGSSFLIVLLITAAIVAVASVILLLLWRRTYTRPAQPQPSGEEVRKRQLLKKNMSRTSFRSIRPPTLNGLPKSKSTTSNMKLNSLYVNSSPPQPVKTPDGPVREVGSTRPMGVTGSSVITQI